jgi:hypothetical protein
MDLVFICPYFQRYRGFHPNPWKRWQEEGVPERGPICNSFSRARRKSISLTRPLFSAKSRTNRSKQFAVATYTLSMRTCTVTTNLKPPSKLWLEKSVELSTSLTSCNLYNQNSTFQSIILLITYVHTLYKATRSDTVTSSSKVRAWLLLCVWILIRDKTVMINEWSISNDVERWSKWRQHPESFLVKLMRTVHKLLKRTDELAESQTWHLPNTVSEQQR